MSQRFGRVLFCIVLAIVFVSIMSMVSRPLSAQGTTATISGTISDTTGAVIPNAVVKVTDVDTGVVLSTITNSQGRYNAPALAIGNYTVEVSAPGFQTTTHSGITLSVGSESAVDFSMTVGQTQQTVTVQGEVSQVETTSTAVSSLVDQTQMRELPLNGRNVEQLILLAPGVQSITTVGYKGGFIGNANGYSFSGERPEDQGQLLDGQDMVNYWGRGMGATSTGSSLGIDAIAEFEVLTGPYSAQYGGNGSVVNQATKSGTNSFHGDAYDFLRNSALDASNYFQKTGIPPFRKNQFGGSVGGPIKRDKLFFFANYEGIRQLLSETEVATVPDANAHNGYLPCATAGSKFTCLSNGLAYVGVAPNVASTMAIYPIPTQEVGSGVGNYIANANQIESENYILGRVDYNISSKDSIFARYLSDRATYLEPFAYSSLPYWPDLFTTPNQFVTIEERHIFSPNLINSVRFSLSRTSNGQVNNVRTTPALEWYPGTNLPDGNLLAGSGITEIGPDAENLFRDVQNKFQEADDLIWTHGAHTLKIGAMVQRLQTNVFDNVYWGGFFSFNSLPLFMEGNAYSVTGLEPNNLLAAAGYPPQSTYFEMREIDINPYIQDTWKVNNKLTVNAGLRYDFATNPTDTAPIYEIPNPPNAPAGCSEATGILCFRRQNNIDLSGNPSLRNFDPRVGLAYDPFADHKTSVRVGFALLHDPIPGFLWLISQEANPPEVSATQYSPAYPFPFSSVSPTLVPGGSTLQFITRTPYAMLWDLSVQRELPSSWLLSVTYSGLRGVHQNLPVDINPVQFRSTCPTSTATNSPVVTMPTPVLACLESTGPTTATLVSNPRIDPVFGSMNSTQQRGWSTYNGLQVELDHRFAGNFTEQLSYTYSHCLDLASGTEGTEVGGAGGNQDPYNIQADKGQCGYDIRHTLRINTLYLLPFKGNELFKGWQLGGIISASTGLPISIVDGFDYVGDQGSNSRPNRVPCSQLILGKVNEWYNPACFALQAPGTFGDAGRTNVPGPNFFDLDASIIKDTKIPQISEAFDVQFRAEFFNVLNHPDFQLAGGTGNGPGYKVFTETPAGTGVVSATAGEITQTSSTARQIQLALKVIF